jgi:AcrR family transcriptional regulator
MPAKQGRYHHGDLKTALVDAAIEVIAERGVRDFSLAEVSRRLGVTTAAPYRHFADRDQLIAAVSTRAVDTFSAILTDVAKASDGAADADAPARRLAEIAGAYVRFSASHRALFETVFTTGLDKSQHPELQRALAALDAQLAFVIEVCDGDPVAAEELGDAVVAIAHGCAMLLLDGAYGKGDDAVDIAAGKAIAATRALIAGRAALLPASSGDGTGST